MKTKIYMLLLPLLAVVSSCNHKDLCYLDETKVRIVVEYDWSDAPYADPRGMCVFFYSKDDGSYYRFDFDNPDGGEIEIPAGRYLVITYNNDTEVVRFSGTNHFDSHTAYTREGDLLEPLYGNGVSTTAKTDNNERVCIAPDALWGCHQDEVEISESGVSYTYIPYRGREICKDCSANTETHVITLYPHDMLCHYSYEVRNVENAEYISKISTSLSGMAGEMNMWDESLHKELITIPVGGKVDFANKKVTGAFLTFGHTDDAAAMHKMTFFVIMTDGSKYRIENYDNLNVTTQVDNAPDKRHVHIIIDGLKVPVPHGDGDGGWNPTLDDWGVENEDLYI